MGLKIQGSKVEESAFLMHGCLLEISSQKRGLVTAVTVT